MAGCAAASAAEDAGALLPSLAVKNTFIHIDTAEEGALPPRRRLSVPPSARLAGRPRGGSSPSSKLSLQPALDTDSEASTLSAASPRGSAGEDSASPSCADSVASSTPLASPRRQCWADETEDAGLLAPPPPPPVCARPRRDRPQKQLNANAAVWTPAAAAAHGALPAVDPLARALTAQVASLMEQLQVTFNCGSAKVKVEVVGGELSPCCVVMWIRPGDSWLTESLLTAAREALLRISSERSGVYVLGFNGRPFTPQPNGFSGILAKMDDRTQACWEMYKQGSCGRGAACRWQHPTVGFPVNVLVAVAGGADVPAA
mmetsp:Transcript_44339/g.119387  ORF Transcript_44339/g.119387 Transcript_44339/m.119387 type:complete len:317 (-) Transcript_44339:104-1054(-)